MEETDKNKERGRQLLRKYQDNTATPEEQALIETWYIKYAEKLLPQTGNDEERSRDRVWAKLSEKPKIRPLRKWLPYAAAIFFVISASIWIFLNNQSINPQPKIVNEIMPGGNRATLTLSDGRTITLDETRSGIIVGNENIIYNDGTTSVVALNENDKSLAKKLTLTTPRGGTYHITLPDGSQVWLNANSTLRYPSRFDGNERVVELEGEAYFEIQSFSSTSDNKQIPFKVISSDQTVEVMGTKFNISAYADDSENKTTLVEGSVRVLCAANQQSPITIKPGEQMVTSTQTILINNVDTQQYIAWKNGQFYFNRTPFAEMIRQVARWYDVEIVYQGKVPEETFTGKMERNLTLEAMLDLLGISDATIRLDDRKLIVQ